MRKAGILTTIAATAAAAALLSCAGRHNGNGNGEAAPPPMGFDPASYIQAAGEVRNGETLPALLQRFGMDPSGAASLATACRDTFDVRRMRAGNKVTAYYSGDSLRRNLEYFVYADSRIKSTIFRCSDTLHAWTYTKPTSVERKSADITITSSLWNDMLAAGVSPLVIVELADIYAWTVNFFGLRQGDRFRLVFDQKVCGDEVVGIEKIDYCIYDSGSYHAEAVRFDQGDGHCKYWNEKGESMRKAFLKAPLQYNRISSGFTYHRRHPITGKVRPHTAVDYAAPKGTPVRSIGDGTVTLCGWDSSGGGKRIKIRHINGYETSYMHLSGFAKGIRSGAHVSQGQTIGFVGSTGHSTGPHLDFRVWKNGTPVNPLKMSSPPIAPLNKENMDSLGKLLLRYRAELGIQ